MKNKIDINVKRKSLFLCILIAIVLSTYFVLSTFPALDSNSTENTLENTEQCVFMDDNRQILDRADIEYNQVWSNEEGHTVTIYIDELPDEHKIEIKKNNEVIDEFYENTEIEYDVGNSDEFVITQYDYELELSDKVHEFTTLDMS